MLEGKTWVVLPFMPFPFFQSYNQQLMNSRATLALLLIAMLLADSINGLKWQGTGSGMNNTVLTEIWTGLEANLNTALTTNSQSGYNSFTKEISDRLTNRWDKAWNVVLVKSQAKYDTVLYGYAFNNQWMWFNGVPNSVLTSSYIATLIVWKDYNCQDWKYTAQAPSSFSQNQKETIGMIIPLVSNQQGFKNDIWGVTHTLMVSLEQQTAFSTGAYSVIMSQDPLADFYGRVCRVGDSFHQMQKVYTYNTMLAGVPFTYYIGAMYMFQTRQPEP